MLVQAAKPCCDSAEMLVSERPDKVVEHRAGPDQSEHGVFDMARASNADSVPAVKTCEVCGAEYSRKYGLQQWLRSTACSRECARKKGGNSRGHPPLTERFWGKVNKERGFGPNGDCWEWTGHRMKFGYGVIRSDGKVHKAHRISYSINIAPIPDDLMVCHHCDNPACVRPDHLFVGTHQDNMDDRMAKGRYHKAKT